MTTVIKTKKNTKSHQPEIKDGVYQNLKTELIELSPLNYRKYFKQEDLEAFAEELKLHGIISPLTVRKVTNGKFELVAGERRLRAARLAKLVEVPVVIKELTDEQVTEIQLAENLQRENPHPLDEAQAIKRMQETGKNIDEIALRLGKSNKFVYVRLKLLNLIEAYHEIFYYNKVNLQQALEIASISVEGQAEFFKEHCTKWKQKNFELEDLHWLLRKYKYDLTDAPFNTKDKKLILEAEACNGCQFNSSTMKSLFPELAKQAHCSNATCYQNKCTAHVRLGFLLALHTHQPTALLFNGEPDELIERIIAESEEAGECTRYNVNEITILQSPETPDKEDYTDEYSVEEPEFNEAAFNGAMQDYENEMAEYQLKLESGKYQKGLLERRNEFFPVLFSPEPPTRHLNGNSRKGLSMKKVQEAITAGTATPELLQEAVQGILQREERAKEIDKQKVQVIVHKQFEGAIQDISFNSNQTEADTVATRLLIFQSLDWSARQRVSQTLFAETSTSSGEEFYTALLSLTNEQATYLVRAAMASKSESKNSQYATGYVLYKEAEAAGINTVRIEVEQEEKAKEREDRMRGRIKELDKKIRKLQPKE